MELDKIREHKKMAESAMESIIAEYEINTGTHVSRVELNEDVIRVDSVTPYEYQDKYYRNIKLEVRL